MKFVLFGFALLCVVTTSNATIHRYDFTMPSKSCTYAMINNNGVEACVRDCSHTESQMAYAKSTCKEYSCVYSIADKEQPPCLTPDEMIEMMQLPFLSCFENDYWEKTESVCIAWESQRPSDMNAWVSQLTRKLSDESMPALRNADKNMLQNYRALIRERLRSGASYVAYKPFTRQETPIDHEEKTRDLFITQKELKKAVDDSEDAIAVSIAILILIVGWAGTFCFFDWLNEKPKLVINFDGVAITHEIHCDKTTVHSLRNMYSNYIFVVDSDEVVAEDTLLIDIYNLKQKLAARVEV